MVERGTKPNSSMVSGLSSRLSSLASSGPLYLVFTGATPQPEVLAGNPHFP